MKICVATSPLFSRIGEEIQYIFENEVFNNFVWPVLLSLISAVIFWFFFSLLPDNLKENRIRPRIESQIFGIYSSMIHIYEMLMLIEGIPGTQQTNLIVKGDLKFEDLEIGLQNKCLNPTFLYDDKIAMLQKPIGHIIVDMAQKIIFKIDHLFISNQFANYLTIDEVLLLEELKDFLNSYSGKFADQPAEMKTNGIIMTAKNPSLAYLAYSFHEKYPLFLKLQTLAFNFKRPNDIIFKYKLDNLILNENYSSAKKYIRRHFKELTNTEGISILEFHLCLIDYKTGKTKRAFDKLNIILKNKPHLVSYRDFLELFLSEPDIIRKLKNIYTPIEINEFYQVIENEKNIYPCTNHNTSFLKIK